MHYSYQISTSPATAVAVCHQGWSCVIIFTEGKVELSSMSGCLHLVSCYKRRFWTSPLLNTELETKVSENTCLLLRHVISSFLFILKLFTLPTWWKKKKKPKQPKLWVRFLSQGPSSQAAVKCMRSCQTENNFLFLNNKTCIYYRYRSSHLRNIFYALLLSFYQCSICVQWHPALYRAAGWQTQSLQLDINVLTFHGCKSHQRVNLIYGRAPEICFCLFVSNFTNHLSDPE